MSSKRRPPTSDEVFIDHITHIVEDINVANRDLLRFGFLTSTKTKTDQNKSSYIQIIFNEGFIKITDSPDYIFDKNKIINCVTENASNLFANLISTASIKSGNKASFNLFNYTSSHLLENKDCALKLSILDKQSLTHVWSAGEQYKI